MVGDLKSIRLIEERSVVLTAKQADLLLYRFLEEIVYYKDAEQILFGRFDIQKIKKSPWRLSAILRGERIDPQRHELLVDVKAVTLHRFEVAQTPTGWKATIVFDI